MPAHPATGTLADLHQRWTRALKRELEAAIALRHTLHRTPEVSGAETKTAERIAEALHLGAGQLVAGTGRAFHVGPIGPCIALRAELDALPIREGTGAPFASDNGAMHACGHDVHMAALVAVSRAAAGLDLPLGLLALFQPREEVGPTGARDVIESGLLTEHGVLAMIGAHVQPQVLDGHVTADAGAINAAVDEIEIVVSGSGGHAAYPHLTLDPVPALCQIVLALHGVARTAVDPLEPLVVSITQLSASNAPNVISGTARAAGTVRTMRAADRTRLLERLEAAVSATAAAHGCTGSLIVRRGEPALVNDALLASSAAAWLARSDLPRASFASCGSDDFSTYVEALPILMLFVGAEGQGNPAGAESTAIPPMLHDARYLPGDEAVHRVALTLIAGWMAAAEGALTPRDPGRNGRRHPVVEPA